MTPELLERFIAIVGNKNTLGSGDDLTQYNHENRGLYVGVTPLVLKPANTQEISDIVRLAAESGTALVPQGGHTGHVGGAVTDESGTQIVVSLERMNRVRELDLQGNVVVCEAGCVLEAIQKLTDENDRLFPLALGSQGSCQIGGNISTNAGGTGVLAYGNTRQLVMGLEVVLPSGDIWNGLRRLKKDNTGYDLKDLFIGAEGTLGIVTAAVLKLFPKPKGKAVAFCALASVDDAVSLLGSALETAGSSLTAFEFMADAAVATTVAHMDGVRHPLASSHPWYVLMEISSGRSEDDANELMHAALGDALESRLVADAVIASSLQQQRDFWRLRETMPLAQKAVGGSMKHDISIPVHRIADFLRRADKIIEMRIPGAIRYTFGHLGDGNIHYNVTQPTGADEKQFLARQGEINDEIHDLVVAFEGSVAAEHGVGQLKRDLVARTKSPVELSLMQSVKNAVDPQGIMNPGKVLNAK
ncbi:MAG: FAD-binding oxidoreductase [Pseudomonadota bacterium]